PGRGTAEGNAPGAAGREQARGDPRHRGGRGPGPGPPARRTRGAVMTVLCLVELDGGGAADASLRALAFSRDLAAGAGPAGTGPAGAGPASTGPASAGPASNGPASNGEPAGESLAVVVFGPA